MTVNKKKLIKNPRGRPRTHLMPDPIPDTPDNVALILMTTKPKLDDEWEYLKNQQAEERQVRDDRRRSG